MPEPTPLDYEPVARPRAERNIGVIWLFPVLAVGIGIIVLVLTNMPNARARQTSDRVQCANNLRQIALTISTYCSENHGQYPSKAGLLILTEGLNAEAFACPSSDDTKLQATPAQQAATLLSGGHCSYVYVGAGMTDSAGANDVVAFELPENHAREGGNVLWGDGHVTWVPFEALVQLVPELEAGHNPPVIGTLTAKQAKKMYEQKWVPKLASIKNGTWSASLPRPTTRPSAEAK